MSSPWICRRCLLRLIRPSNGQRGLGARFASSGNSTTATTKDVVAPISASLLTRARATAEEHASLKSRLATAYDNATAKRVGELTPIATALNAYESASSSLDELHSLLRDPTSDQELRDLASSDLETASAQLSIASQSLTAALIPRHPFAHLPCLVEIRPGVGGNEAALFAGDLLRMYRSYCSRNNMRTSLLKYEAMDGISDPNGSDAPMAEAILEVQTPGAYGVLRCEAGVHRVQRVPATESKGRTHTSAASVLVLPSFPEGADGAEEMDIEDPNSDYYVHPSDVRTDVMRARGAGGQHVNTTDSAVRLTHIPTGTVVAVQDARSQLKNRAKAWVILRAKLAQAKREAREEELLALRRSAAGGIGKTGRGDKIRTYNWGQSRVTDHRSGFGVSGSLDDVMEGGDNLENIMESVRAWMVEQEIAGLMAEVEEKAKVDAKKKP